MSDQFKTIGLIGRYTRSTDLIDATLTALHGFLLKRGKNVIMDRGSAEQLSLGNSTLCERNELGQRCDLVIVVGGDGSLLTAARAVVECDIPILGINRGHLGFLTDIHPDDFEKEVDAVLAGEYMEEQRFLLTTSIHDNGKSEIMGDALNDVVLTPGGDPHMIEFETYINDQFVCRQRADGLIVATPTGSTAYALSGGGPILDPNLDALVLVPMFPHTLSSRPIVVNGNHEIKIVISENNQVTPQISADGQNRRLVNKGCEIHIRKKDKRLRLIHPKNHNFFSVLRDKLGWETKLTP